MLVKIFKKIFRIILRENKLTKKISSCNDIQVVKPSLKNILFNIHGKNNKIIIKTHNIKGKLFLNIYGDNNTVIIDDNVYISMFLKINIGQNHPNFGKVYNSIFKIEKNTSVESLNYITYNSNTSCEIGKDSMFSYGILIYNTDGHPILDKTTKKLLNHVIGIHFGSHCWVGMNATILKNSYIPDNTIIGCNSVFSGNKFTQPYCAFAGNPARVIRNNVDWDPNGNRYDYIKNEKE